MSFADSITHCKKEGYKNILGVHNDFRDPVWVSPVTRGKRLAFASREVDLQFFYRDTMNHSDENWMANKGDEAITVIGQWVADVVITLGDNAQEYVGKKAAQKGQRPVVFCGVNLNSSQSSLTGQPMLNLDRPPKPGFQLSDDVIRQADILTGTGNKNFFI